MLSLFVTNGNQKSIKQTNPSVPWREMESNTWKTSKPLNFISRIWESEFYVSCSFHIQPRTNPLSASWHRQLQWKGFEGKRLFILSLSWTSHNALLAQDYCVCHCNAKDQQSNYSLLHLVFFCFSAEEVTTACHISFGKSIFHSFFHNLHVLCLLHSISHVGGICSKVGTYIVTNNIQ